jgi:hypothetical protein
VKNFDLNIDKILENWEVSHAIRELIANAIDESIITSTKAPDIYRDDNGWWHVRDYGRGLRYQDLIESENPEKLSHPGVIGKFGIGLKDALATFDRKGVRVLLRSRHGDVSLARVTKHSFEDLVTLHATIDPPSIPDIVGTDCAFCGVADDDVATAKKLFLRFCAPTVLDETKFGAVLRCPEAPGAIFINGMKVAEEPNFLFSYNITCLTAPIKKALNRERQNLGRSAYSERIRAMLLATRAPEVAQALADDLQRIPIGTAHDELAWLDVQEHAVKLLNSVRKVLFVSSEEIVARPDLIEAAKATGFQILSVPENLTHRIGGALDVTGKPITELQAFIAQHNASFEFTWIDPATLSPAEKNIWTLRDRILELIGGRPAPVREIKISSTMQPSAYSMRETEGLWDPNNGWIIIKRSELASLENFAGTLLHEALHAKYGLSDISRDFETYLTRLSGSLAAMIIREFSSTVAQENRRGWIASVLGKSD